MRTRLERTLRCIWSGHRPRRLSITEQLLYYLLSPPAVLYASMAWAWRELYRHGFLRRRRLADLTVVSIGNITVGGTGKSPLVIGLARELVERGISVAVVSRGYGAVGRGSGPLLVSDGSGPLVGPDRAGDEPVMIARAVPVVVIVSRNRYMGARLANDRYGADVVILDDGFQHQGLARDADIVLLDAADPFGNRWTLPAGRLREPLSALQDADLFLIVQRGVEGVRPIPSRLKGLLEAFRREAAIASGVLRMQVLRLAGGGDLRPLEWLRGRSVLLVSGLGDAAPFEAEVKQRGGRVVAHLEFDDHHRYSVDDVSLIRESLREAGAEAVITTAKDEVKLVPAGLSRTGEPEAVWVAEAGFDPRTLDLLVEALI